MTIGKKLKASYEKIDRNKFYSVDEAVKFVKEGAKGRKFDESVDLAINLAIDPKHADQAVRGMFELPHGSGAKVRVAVFAKDAKAKEALAAGADIVGADDLAEKILAGKVDFDRCIATPDMMGVVGKLGKVLGPKGLMPNPKLGTVTIDVKKAVESAKGGAVEFRAEKTGIVQVKVGKASFTEKALTENIRAMMREIVRVKPAGAKGTYLKKVSVSSTMGPGIKLDMSDFAAPQTASKAA